MVPSGPAFGPRVEASGGQPLQSGRITWLQVNVGKRCNQACHHCHVEAGPNRTESLDEATTQRILSVLAQSPGVELVDITGGAPELNPHFRSLVRAARAQALRVIDRSNLSILLEAGQEDLADFLATHDVEVVASLPCYLEENVDKQRGRGVFGRSLKALHKLNSLGYGRPGSGRILDLVYNPTGPYLPPGQAELEEAYRNELEARYGICFNSLVTITNMPIARFRANLERQGQLETYRSLLSDNFNRRTVDQLMCRSMVSVSLDGRLFDCDFNQMLELPTENGPSLWDIESFDDLSNRLIATGDHCFGCTAGAGSSCGGVLT